MIKVIKSFFMRTNDEKIDKNILILTFSKRLYLCYFAGNFDETKLMFHLNDLNDSSSKSQ
jgi:hypothetical protein